MPLAEEKLAEKLPFDVYAVMLVLSALLVIGAILMLNHELRLNWHGADVPGTKRAEYLTSLNTQTEEERTTHGESPWTQITDQDRKDLEILLPDAKFQSSPYPDWLKANTEGVKFLEKINEPGGLPPGFVSKEESDSMKSSYVSETDATAGVLEKDVDGKAEEKGEPKTEEKTEPKTEEKAEPKTEETTEPKTD